ncbi:unnamed protein product [Chondrus crispus]|uniref:Photosystem I subunit O n=1 Tax=Chondrus crispus TaxID=2769 RepID=R7Q2P0_CHOCR|nr:unnamed protein product [Chondrus crispus]CDF32153.1 unnamed protein product [Chondrus crispus]|eukprot:XP_005711818.1 unnamed protein product [Chondrus crispus]
MAFISATPILASSVRYSRAACTVRPAALSSFTGQRAVLRASTPATNTPRMGFEISEGVEFKLDLTILILAIVGWVVPSSIPAGIPLTEGSGLTQAFFASMNANLANFPKGPAGDDPFWTLLFLWHTGLFACMIFGTIGYNSRKVQS